MNTEQHVIDLLPDFLAGTFDEIERNTIQSHLQSCSSCRHEFESLSLLWNSLGTVPDEKPGPQVRERFKIMLAAYEQGIRHAKSRTSVLNLFDERIVRLWPRRPVFQLGIAIVMLVIGGVLGSRMNSSSEQGGIVPPSTEIAQLHGEIQAMSRMLAVSLMQQQSASDRLKGVSMTSRLAENDPKIAQSLLDALRYDPSVNVRLAALDALSGSIDNLQVRNGLIDGLPKQSSPLVQIAMVELVVEARDTESMGTLRKMRDDPKVNDVVRKRIQQGLQQLL